MFKHCKYCKKPFPEYLVEDYPMLLTSPLCPICARGLINRLSGRDQNTPFKDVNQEEAYFEALDFRNNQSKKNWGGHLINPPEDCAYAFKVKDGGIWVDLGNCIRTCKIKCTRYYQFKRMSELDRKEELIENGVING